MARPLFEIPRAPDDKRLTDQDAEVVECIHTDAEVAGYVNPVGTIDFFPNGGSGLQPNCLKNIHIPHSFKDLQYEGKQNKSRKWQFLMLAFLCSFV